ncbi:hypothetical protein CBS101457_003678 [Exobasidium rhododendri]|nr:hypothetical protein CBS101457_003678 [Exobasidium rhododendri]
MAALFGGWGADPFSESVDKATSELLPAGQEDIALNLEICDQVRAKQVPPKQAMQVIKKRLGNKNPNVVLLALGLTDICIKNGGDHFLAEVASREFMDNLVSILRSPAGVNNDVKVKALSLIQNWSQIAEAKPLQMGYISETYKSLKRSGFDFPPMDSNAFVSAALVETMTAPEWIDGDVCMRCRTAFTTFNRKHHCRNCGNVFCQDCSSKSMALPWFGVGQDVRVCDGCYARKSPPKVNKLERSTSTQIPSSGRGGAGSHHRSRTLDGDVKKSKSSREDDDLALAIKMSLESSSASGSGSRPGFVTSQPPVKEGRPTRQADGRMLEGTDTDDDPDLAAAIAASLRDFAMPVPSAPDGGFDDGRATPRPNEYGYTNISEVGESRLPLPPSLDLPAPDMDALLSFAQDASAQEAYARQHGQWQGRYQQQKTQELYERATAARPKMARNLDEATRRHGVLISMHDKLTEAVRLYDRLLDAQMSRPAMYASPYYAGSSAALAPPSFAGQVPYMDNSTMYPSLPPQQGNNGYGEPEHHQYIQEQQQHHPQTLYPQQQRPYHQQPQQVGSPAPSSMSYAPMESPNPYHSHQAPQYFTSQSSYPMTMSSQPDVSQSQYSQQQQQQQHQQQLQQHVVQQPLHQQFASAAASAPLPPLSSASSQVTGSSNANNHWQALDSLPSAPNSKNFSEPWTTLSPPSQDPAHGSIYGNIPNLPQFEALPAHEQQLPQLPSAPGLTSPPLVHDSIDRNTLHMNGQDDESGWRDIPIKKIDSTSDTPLDSARVISSPYTAQPWTRPVETPLIDL